jgi:hypothetical protein
MDTEKKVTDLRITMEGGLIQDIELLSPAMKKAFPRIEIWDFDTEGCYETDKWLKMQAADDLFQALQDLHNACDHWENQDDPVLKAARAAITKARGGE